MVCINIKLLHQGWLLRILLVLLIILLLCQEFPHPVKIQLYSTLHHCSCFFCFRCWSFGVIFLGYFWRSYGFFGGYFKTVFSWGSLWGSLWQGHIFASPRGEDTLTQNCILMITMVQSDKIQVRYFITYYGCDRAADWSAHFFKFLVHHWRILFPK